MDVHRRGRDCYGPTSGVPPTYPFQYKTMQLSNFAIVAAIEIFALLIAVGTLLLWHTKKQRGLIRRQQEKLQQLILQIKQFTLPSVPAQPSGQTYKTHVLAQLAATRNRYYGFYPNGDLSAPPATQGALTRQALALRNSFLQTEERAILKGDGPLHLDWQAFEIFAERLLMVPEATGESEELVNYKQRVENLERFKTLFFDMERQWENARHEAQNYYAQLSAMVGGVENADAFTDVLNRYNNVYAAIGEGFSTGNRLMQAASATTAIGCLNPASSEEIIKLRNVAADQHRIINQLQRKLEEAFTSEEKEAVIGELQQQLLRQTRFVQESEMCVQLLEDELAAASEKMNKQQQQLQESAGLQQENERVKETLQNFTLESKMLISKLLEKERENEMLISSNTQREAESPDALKKIQAEFATLKNQYVELETRYLDLKMGH